LFKIDFISKPGENVTLNEWKARLLPAGVLFLCYFVVPGIVRLFMGAHDVISGRFTVSILIQAGLGLALVRKLFGLKDFLGGELTAWLNRFAQPQGETQELAGQILLAAGFVSIVAIVWPPVGEMLPGGRLMTLIKVSALGYAGYLGYKIWKLAEPFMSYVPPPEPSEDPAPPSGAASGRRCAKCGQLVGDSAEFCEFCRQPVR